MLFDKLNILSKAEAPSNFEDSVNLVINDLLSYAETVETDCLRNYVAGKNTSSTKPIILMAHSDEIGFLVNYIDNDGYLHLKSIGGVNPSILECLRINIHHDDKIVPGVICKQSLSNYSDRKVENISELWLDIGCSTFDEAASLVSIGDFATFSTDGLMMLGPNNKIVCGKALDNRVGILVVSEVFNTTQCSIPLYVCCSAQEEVGCRGAGVIANKLKPAVCIVVDVTYATDFPGANKNKYGDISLDKGVVIPIGANINNCLQRQLMLLADGLGVKYQVEALAQSSGTDAKSVQITGEGVNTVLVSIPCRYMHSPIEMVSINDVKDAILLISEFVNKWENLLATKI